MGHALDAVTSLHWRPVGSQDVPVLSELFTAIERQDDPAERHSIDELRANLPRDPETAAHTVVGFDADVAVAVGWNLSTHHDGWTQVFLSGGVHPSWRQLGIGRRLLGWQQEQAADVLIRGQGSLEQRVMVAHSDEKSVGRRALFTRLGLIPVRRHLDLFRALSDELPPSRLPAGIELRPWSEERAEDVRMAHNDAFADVPRARVVRPAEWAQAQASESARPAWSWLACDTRSDTIVGYVTNVAHTAEWEAQGFSQGWTDRIGVRRAWRGQGIARALLIASMQSFAADEIAAAGLGVDTDRLDGPVQPYHGLGYLVADSVLRYEGRSTAAEL